MRNQTLWKLELFHHVFVSVCVLNMCQARQKEYLAPCGTSFVSLFDFVAHLFRQASSKLNSRMV